jgi:transposase-like protein
MPAPNLNKIRRAAAARATAEDRFRAEIVAAHRNGRYSMAQIAEAAGVTKQRVWQIIHGRR